MEQILIDFIDSIIAANEIPIHHYNPDIPCDDWNWFDLGLREKVLGDSSLKHLQSWFNTIQNQEPCLYQWSDPFQCCYVAFQPPQSHEWLILGPFLFEEIKGERFNQLFTALRLSEHLRVPLQNHYYNVKFIPYHAVFESFIHLIADFTFGKEQYKIVYLSDEDTNAAPWNWEYRSSAAGLSAPENPFLNVTYLEERYEAENAVIRAVSAGNDALALANFSKMTSHMLPQRLSSELRDIKSYTITLNTLMRKAAETAGVHPYHIDRMSNSNIQKLEHMVSVEQCQHFQRKIIKNYCQLVKDYNLKDYSMPVRKAITYINVDLSADLSLKSLASLLNVNASYLSTLFKKETGVTLTEYVNKCRIQHAKKLLLDTKLPIQDIALQCGISDIGYFSRMFKRITGTTPRAYREKEVFIPTE